MQRFDGTPESEAGRAREPMRRQTAPVVTSASRFAGFAPTTLPPEILPMTAFCPSPARPPRLPRLPRPALFLFLCALSAPAAAQQGFDTPPASYPPPAQAPAMPQTPPAQADFPAPAQGDFPPSGAAAGFPPQGSTSNPMPAGYGPPAAAAPAATGAATAMQALLQAELQDYGVPAQPQLQTQFHGPTPTSIPGGQVITTDRLLGLYQQAPDKLLVFHVLGPGPMLPNAQNAAPASQAGNFDDRTQQEFGQYLQQVTQGDKARPMVFYCLNTHCWMSYNAALRAIRMGFSQVYWYRGGIEAWQQAQQLAGR
jgi:PQQ-dependent catabolism-associated CXXCW motif protein